MEVSRRWGATSYSAGGPGERPLPSIRGQRSLYVRRPGVARIRRRALTGPGGGPRIRQSSTSKESMRMAWP
jgi:hypothetical protein